MHADINRGGRRMEAADGCSWPVDCRPATAATAFPFASGTACSLFHTVSTLCPHSVHTVSTLCPCCADG
eukprot:137794-Chlamydomonas_euryale.AAC.2